MQIAVSGVLSGRTASIVLDGGVIDALTGSFQQQGPLPFSCITRMQLFSGCTKKKRKPTGGKAVWISDTTLAKCKPSTLFEDPVGLRCLLAGPICAVITE